MIKVVRESIETPEEIIKAIADGFDGKISSGSKNVKFTGKTERGYDTFNAMVDKANSLGLKEYGFNNGNVTVSGMHYNFKTANGKKVKIINKPSSDFKSYTPTIIVEK